MVKFLTKRWLELKKRSYLKRKIYRKRKREVPVEKARRFLCIQMNAIGDAIMTQPAWSMLKSTLPDARVDLLCRPHIAPLFETDPSLYSILPCENRRYRTWLFKNKKEVKRLFINSHYDVLIDFTALPITACLCTEKEMPPSVGFRRKLNTMKGKIDLGMAYDLTFPYSDVAHVRDLMLSLISPSQKIWTEKRRPVIRVSSEDIEKAFSLLKKKDLADEKFLVFHPGAKWAPRRWPVRYWRNLIKIMRQRSEFPIIVLGGPEDKALIAEICRDWESVFIQVHISENIVAASAIIRLAALCVCNDSAAMHLSAALGTNSISIFGPGSPERTAPSKEEGCTVLYDEMFCSPCLQYYSRERCKRGINFCMYAIKPEKVLKKMEEILLRMAL